jgi:prefoldin subunit 5
MKSKVNVAAAVLLAASLVTANAQTSGSSKHLKKHVPATKTAQPTTSSLEEQIQALRREMQSQIDSLKQDLATKDAQLQKAQQDAAEARAAATKAETDAQTQQTAVTENNSAVSTLQSTVSDLKSNQASLATTVSDETTKIKKAINSPDAIHFKGATISFTGSFIAAETVNRTTATGGGLNTAFTGVPLQNSDAYQMSEFQGTGRQSRLAIKGTSKLPNWVFAGYYEADWLGTGITSNNNQSNSYVLRQRQMWADARMNSGWDFSGGQGWSLVAETTQGLTRGSEILPATIDPQYEAGFVWTRQYSFRVAKNIGRSLFLGASVENAQILNPAGQNLPSNYVFGSTGTGGGLYNPTANYSFNYSPDFVVKMALEPGWGHWELFGIERNFRDRIYPTGASAYNNRQTGAGIGGGFRGPLFDKKVTVGLKGLWGQGVGRYGSSTIADVTIRPDGTFSPLHGFSALSTVELNPTPRLNIYLNYGGDYIGRDWTLNTAGQEVGYGTYTANMSGCMTETNTSGAGASGGAQIAPAGCTANNKDVQEFTAGYWFNIHDSAAGRLRQGIQYSLIRRDLWSGNGGVTNPDGGAHGDDNMIFTSFRYYLP